MEIVNGITLRVQNQKRGTRALGNVILDTWETAPIYFTDTRELREVLRLESMNIFRILDEIPQGVLDLLEISKEEDKGLLVDIKSGLVYKSDLNYALKLKADLSLVEALTLRADELTTQINEAKGTFPNLIDKLNSMIMGETTSPDLTALIADLQAVTAQADANAAEIFTARDGFASLIEKLNAVAAQRLADDDTTLQLDRLAAELLALQLRVDDLAGDMTTALADIGSLKTEMNSARGAYVNLAARLAEFDLARETDPVLQATVDGLVTDVGALETEIGAARGTYANLLEKLNTLASSDPALKTAVDGLVTDMDAVQVELTAARSTFTDLAARLVYIQANATGDPQVRSDLDAVTAESAALLTEITAARGTYTDLTARLAAITSGGVDPALQTTVDSLDAEMTAARTTYANLAARLTAIQTLAESGTTDPAVQSELDALTAEMTAARSTFTNVNERLLNIESTVANGSTGTDPTLQATVDALDAEVLAARATFVDLAARLANIQATAENNTTDPAVQSELDALTAEMTAARTTFINLAARLADMDTRIASAAAHDPALRTDIDAVVEELSVARGTFSSLNARFANIETLIADAGETDPVLQATVDSLDAEVTAARTTFLNLTARLAAIQEIAETPKIHADTQSAIDALQTEMTAARSTFVNVDARFRDLELTLSNSEASEETYRATVDSLDAEVTAARATFASLHARFESIEATLGGSGADQELTNRVKALEMQTSTATKLHAEDFTTSEHIDVSKTTAVFGSGYVRAAHVPDFAEEFMVESNSVDLVNSTNVEVTGDGKLKMVDASLEGVMHSKSIPSPGLSGAQLDAVVEQSTALSFSEETIFTKQATAYEAGGRSIIDRNGHRWYMKVSDGFVHIKIEGATVAESVDWTQIAISTPTSSGKASLYTESSTASMGVDYNNKVWIVVPIGTTAAEFAVFALNPDLTFYKSPTEIDCGTSAGFNTDLLIDRNNNVWVATTGSSGSRLGVYNGPDTQLLSVLTSMGSVRSVNLVYDSNRDLMHWFYADVSYVESITYDLSFNVVVPSTRAAYQVGVPRFRGMTVSFDPVSDSFIMFGVSTAAVAPMTGYVYQAAKMKYTTTGFTNVDVPETERFVQFPTPTIQQIQAGSLIKDGVAHIVYEQWTDSVTSEIEYLSIRMSDFALISESYPIVDQSDAGYGLLAMRPYLFEDGTELCVMYDASATYSTVSERANDRHVRMRKMVLTSTEVNFYLSNDNGTIWHLATPGEYLTFPAAGDQLRVRMVLGAVPGATIVSPLVDRYSLTFTSDNGEYIRELITTGLPALNPASQATLTAEMEVVDGTVEWYISNNGGVVWDRIMLGVAHKFSNHLGTDVRLRAVISKPLGLSSPVIRGYSLVSGNTAMVTDLKGLELNLMLTNFRLASLTNATRYALNNMVVDTFTDASGINEVASSMNWMISDGAIQRLVESNVYTPMTASNVPSPQVVSASGQLSATYPAWKAFDGISGNGDSRWVSSGAPSLSSPQWVQIDLGSLKTITEYSINYPLEASTNMFQDWTFSGSSNGVDWTVLDNRVDEPNWISFETRTYAIPRSTYRYYRLSVTKGYDNVHVGELGLGNSSEGTVTVLSQEDVLSSVPTTLLFAAEDEGAVTYEVSRDAGVTWMVITPNQITDLSSLPSGTSLVIKATFDGASTIYAWSYSWK